MKSLGPYVILVLFQGSELLRDAPAGACMKFFKTGHCPFGLSCRYSHRWNPTTDDTRDEKKCEERKSSKANCLSNTVNMTSSRDPPKKRKVRPEGTVQVNREVYHRLLQNSEAVEEGEVERLRKEVSQLRKRNVLLEEKNLRLEQEKKVLEKMLKKASNLPNQTYDSKVEVEPVAVKDEPLSDSEVPNFGVKLSQDQKGDSHLNWRFDQREESTSTLRGSQHPAHQLALAIGPISSKWARV